jgi:hypothetical protein
MVGLTTFTCLSGDVMRHQMIRYAVTMLTVGFAFSTSAYSASIDSLIVKAGNTTDEVDRYNLLKALTTLPDIEEPLRADLDKLMPIVDRLVNDLPP